MPNIANLCITGKLEWIAVQECIPVGCVPTTAVAISGVGGPAFLGGGGGGGLCLPEGSTFLGEWSAYLWTEWQTGVKT